MQTFLPYPNFSDCAAVLDTARLGKQRVETLQILKALTTPDYGWQNHPAVKMWKGFESHLVRYGIHICAEWKARGHADTCMDKICSFLFRESPSPEWITPDLCLSHQSNLIRKLPTYYRPHFPEAPDNLPYLWPK